MRRKIKGDAVGLVQRQEARRGFKKKRARFIRVQEVFEVAAARRRSKNIVPPGDVRPPNCRDRF